MVAREHCSWTVRKVTPANCLGHALLLLAAAALINSTTSCGCETITTWLEATSSVSAPIRLANICSRSGGMASSLVATRYHVGCDLQAGAPITSSSVRIDRPGCTACMIFALAGSMSVAK